MKLFEKNNPSKQNKTKVKPKKIGFIKRIRNYFGKIPMRKIKKD